MCVCIYTHIYPAYKQVSVLLRKLAALTREREAAQLERDAAVTAAAALRQRVGCLEEYAHHEQARLMDEKGDFSLAGQLRVGVDGREHQHTTGVQNRCCSPAGLQQQVDALQQKVQDLVGEVEEVTRERDAARSLVERERMECEVAREDCARAVNQIEVCVCACVCVCVCACVCVCVCVCACVCLSLCVLYVSRCIYIWALRHSREGGCVLCLGMYLCVLYVFIYIGALRHSGGGAAPV